MFQIIQVEVEPPQHLFHGVGIAIIERGIRGHAGPNLIEELIAGVALHNLVDVVLALRPGADERHVALQHIPQLGQLVEMMVAQEPADVRHALVLLVTKEHRAVFLGIHAHGAELVNDERTPKAADAFLLEDGWPAVLALHENIAYQHQRREYHQAHTRREKVGEALDVPLHLVHSVGNEPRVVDVVVPLDV